MTFGDEPRTGNLWCWVGDVCGEGDCREVVKQDSTELEEQKKMAPQR